MPHTRTYLPLVQQVRHGSRSHMTCHFRCGNACDQPEPNQSGNPHIGDILATTISRRMALKGGAAGAAALVVSTTAGTSVAAAATGAGQATAAAAAKGGIIAPGGFNPVEPNKRDAVTVPDGYRYNLIARWGDAVVASAPAFNAYKQTPAKQAKQFGYNCDYVGIHHLSKSRAVMAVNNEYTDEILMFPDGVYTEAEQKAIAMQAHGISVIEIERGRRKGSWKMRNLRHAKLNRRITATTPTRVTGPAAGHAKMKTNADPTGKTVLGTFANCSGGVTPWGTTLHGEENFNGYFDASGELDPANAASYARYGITGAGKGWKALDDRWDLTLEPNEPYRFGWIVEVDVMHPRSKPRKRTMLGRMKHEGATCSISNDGHAVVYMGDDERGDYIYKFVSRRTYNRRNTSAARRHNLRLLDEGTLYVARFTGDGLGDGKYDGTGEWIALTSDKKSFVPGFTVAQVLLDTRIAADAVGATRMDRPEDIERNPVNGKVYAALTNNSNRGTTNPVDEANPLASSMTRPALDQPLVSQSGNRNGYVLELTEKHDDQEAEVFNWDLFLVCGDPEAPETYFGGFPKSEVSPVSCPDNVAFDTAGNLWISTDGNVLGSNDGLLAVPVAGPNRGKVQQFLTVSLGAETCGPWISYDRLSVFAAVQHPGEIDGFSFDDPASTWPHTDAFPRPSVLVAYRDH